MHVNFTAEFTKVMLTLVSDLQRDLRWSSVMRSFSAIMVYSYQQITTTERLLNSLAVDEKRINENFNRESKLVMGELLHLCLQRQGYAKTHELVNKKIVPGAAISGADLPEEMNNYLLSNKDRKLKQVWKSIPNNIIDLMKHPEKYIGNAIGLARNEVLNELTLANK
jgi:adenylosuccinate lyase